MDKSSLKTGKDNNNNKNQGLSASIRPEKDPANCDGCGKTDRLLPPFDEYLWGKTFMIQLCHQCYNQYCDDEHWLVQQLEKTSSPSRAGEVKVLPASWQRLPQTNPPSPSAAPSHLSSLERYRRQQNLSRKDLGQLSGLDPSTIRLLEQGKTKARAATLQKLAQVLQIPLLELEELAQGQSHSPYGGSTKGRGRVRRRDYNPQVPSEQLRGGQLLLRLRLELGFTQAQLARASSSKRGVISALENDLYDAKKEKQLQRLAQYLGVSPSDVAPQRDVQLTLKLV